MKSHQIFRAEISYLKGWFLPLNHHYSQLAYRLWAPRRLWLMVCLVIAVELVLISFHYVAYLNFYEWLRFVYWEKPGNPRSGTSIICYSIEIYNTYLFLIPYLCLHLLAGKLFLSKKLACLFRDADQTPIPVYMILGVVSRQFFFLLTSLIVPAWLFIWFVVSHDLCYIHLPSIFLLLMTFYAWGCLFLPLLIYCYVVGKKKGILITLTLCLFYFVIAAFGMMSMSFSPVSKVLMHLPYMFRIFVRDWWHLIFLCTSIAGHFLMMRKMVMNHDHVMG